MAGSPEYLALLDYIELAHNDPALAPALAQPIGWPDITDAWDNFKEDPERETALITLSHLCLALYTQQREANFADVILTAKTLHINKNAGYAGADNPDPWANFRLSELFGISPFDGVLVRMSDKYIRILNLQSNTANERVGESILDTLMDLAAYSLIAVCLLRETRRSLMN